MNGREHGGGQGSAPTRPRQGQVCGPNTNSGGTGRVVTSRPMPEATGLWWQMSVLGCMASPQSNRGKATCGREGTIEVPPGHKACNPGERCPVFGDGEEHRAGRPRQEKPGNPRDCPAQQPGA